MHGVRTAASLIVASLVIAACASAGPEELVTSEVAASTTTTTTTLEPTTSTTTTTTTTTVPPDPYETLVANIKDDVSVLEAFETPDGQPAEFEFEITNPTYFGNPLVLMITDRTEDEQWLKVQIPVRPNGTEAWIRTGDADIGSHRFRARINVTDRAVSVWNGEELVVETEAVVGKASTPTPLGRFFVNDLVEKWDGSAYGPYILSLSGFSEALETFGGGIPVIAIHGTNRPDLLGGAYSNGCIRIPNEVIRILAETVPMGTPVDIVA